MEKLTIGNNGVNAGQKIKKDISGQRYGRLVAIKQVGWVTDEKTGNRKALWLWQCDCGNQKEIPATQVKHGGTRSCGCLLREHVSDLRKEDISGRRFGRLTAIRPTINRDKKGNILWELACECGQTTYKTVNELKTGRVLSCGCLYKDSRSKLAQHRKDFVESTSLSAIVISKRARSHSTSGHTGVWQNKKTGRWEAYIYFRKTRFRLGSFGELEDAIQVRREAERRLHDPIVEEYWDHLTEGRKKEFMDYLRETGKK